MKAICRLLIALMVWMPYQLATAGMIGTDRTTVLNFLNRSDVSSQLQTLGIDPSTAKDRIAAMSDQEVQSLAGRIDAVPAGGTSAVGAIVIIILIAGALWWFWLQR